MAQHNLAWMPTLSGDTQAVLATDKVRYQGQEVAAVIADGSVHREGRARADRGRLRAAPGGHDPAAVARGRRAADPRREGGPDRQPRLPLGGGRQGGDRRRRSPRRTGSSRSTPTIRAAIPRRSRCCGCVADVNPATGQATIYMTSQAPHAHRTLFAMVAGLPEEKIRIISPDIGGGFGNKVPIYPGYVVATAASLLIGRPVKWIEDRSENLISTGFARDYHMHGELAIQRRQDHRAAREDALRPGSVLRRRAADEVPGRAVPHRHRLVRLSRRRRSRRTARTRTRRREASRTAARSASPRRRT